jgi:hypothetical protein
MNKLSKYSAALPPSMRNKILVPFVSNMKKMDRVDGSDAEKIIE